MQKEVYHQAASQRMVSPLLTNLLDSKGKQTLEESFFN